MNDLKNQIAFIKKDNPQPLDTYGIDDLENELRLAKARYNEWSRSEERKRTTSRSLKWLILDTLKFRFINYRSY